MGCGFIVALRGKGGGIRLSREPEAIRPGQIVRASSKGNAPIVECLSDYAGTAPARSSRPIPGAARRSAPARSLIQHRLYAGNADGLDYCYRAAHRASVFIFISLPGPATGAAGRCLEGSSARRDAKPPSSPPCGRPLR
ncbi:MAG: hypothetical protein D4R84_15920 [Rhodocyclaceae bacterium]|nr:MAG: hypothetical protein D4R84_15920 [Rhodocyclaceae bacterium]